MARSVLIVDDDPVQRRLLEAAVSKAGHAVITADSGEAGLSALERSDIGVVILDLVMPGMDGLQVLERMREREIEIPVIVQTSKGSIDTAVSAMRAGAFDFVVKPASPERLQVAVANAMKVESFGGEAKRAKKGTAGSLTFADIVTGSPSMQRVITLARKAAGSSIPILIEGESGSGKEVIARAIQAESTRRSKAFVTVNCGAIPDNLVESILFGHEKGSFTGATEKHVGKFVEANGGTLFLDEIGDLPLDVQVKLLRAVQEGEVDPVGARQTVKVDIRLISATHRDLLQRVEDGKFREDLFYRLNVFPIYVPPLRDRREDIPRLVQHFISRVGPAETRGRVNGISPTALAMLQSYDWPGNIRQLENAIFRAVVLAEGSLLTENEFPQIRAQVDGIDITAADTAPAPPPSPATAAADTSLQRVEEAVVQPAEQREAAEPDTSDAPFGFLQVLDARGNMRTLAEIEHEVIRRAIDHYKGQMSEVARRLGIGRSTLYRKLKEMGITPEEERSERLAS
ncbi:sigma-54-dependent transcriptional regulator [Aquamicrobium zhengzhouense]|uniref:DNA-binding transcriptional regulator NtrC n=1 Tax=Aquamicrobium zhengzhouense TaxID=2781738 RepID=A0ABS0S8R9_9HYPH|nr:sigma-54 dependent transcriptional regulator [Aquamicrobium zhengzhouense]MBI1619700.1 sigma-54-dependent Fis family transcriptional regulator [Aquamicrobium zhengzhouense]